jgi:catechol 2,3-dioxygenase-like lactoylglutathione lyase family enzyme
MFTDQIVFLFTQDLPATAQFYEQLLGLELALDQGNCRIYRVTANSYVGFCERAKSETAQDGIILTLVTPDVDAWYERLSSLGVRFEKPPAFNPRYRIYHCFLRDPNGYMLEIQRFEDPAWLSV